jgi:predicted nucleic-acid-binding Zn-ribbon protein
MKNGNCPKCGSSNVYHETNGIYVPNTLGTFIRTADGNVGSRTDDYICADCGYIERYVADEHKLKEVARVWKRAS